MSRIVLKVNGMKCGGCATAVEEALEAVSGVSSVDVSLDEAEARVEATPEVRRETLVGAVRDAGYAAE